VIVAAGLLAEWRFDDGAGQVLSDRSGNGRHGQPGNTAGADSSDPAWQSYGLSFDGTDHIVLPNGLITGNHAISWLAVVTDHVVSGFQIFAMAGAQIIPNNYFLGFNGTDILAAVFGGTQSPLAPPPAPFSVAAVYDPAGPSSTLYLNGTLSQTHAPGAVLDMVGAFTLGTGSSGGFPFQGGLASATLHETPLSSGQAQQMHAYAKTLVAGLGVTLP
jgi:hypothetical protein